MTKEKKSKTTSLPQKNVHLRLAFLHQAASHLANQPRSDTQTTTDASRDGALPRKVRPKTSVAQPRYLINQMKGVSRKSVIRLDKNIKRTICKRCDESFVEGRNSASIIENKSTNRSKPWADVLIVKCETCGTSKRFPVGSSELGRKPVQENKQELSRRASLTSRSGITARTEDAIGS